jgi:sphingolipid 4-desaturase/C4-monooxygenase
MTHVATPYAAEPARDFRWTDTEEPHAERRRAMLAKYPQIETLYGPCPRTKYVCIALVTAQLLVSYSLRDAPWWLLFVVAYLFGGVANQAPFLALHELSHNLAFKSPLGNRAFSLFANLPAGIPAAATFKHYHLLHHTHQGTERFDTDLPTALESRVFRGKLRKTIWLAFQGLAYGLRPLLVHPKKPDGWELLNVAVQLTFNVAIYWAWGAKALAYLPLSSVLVMGLHPIAGHYISEHYMFAPGQETYSYYGPLNRITFNVGYHNEHHDFPYIAGSRLPELKRIAPEFYDSLHSHTSWTRTLWRFVTDPTIAITNRTKRV